MKNLRQALGCLAMALAVGAPGLAGEEGAGHRVALSSTIDFSSYAMDDSEGGPELYPLEVWERRIKDLAQGGLSKLYFRIGGGVVFYPNSRASYTYGEEHGSSKYLYPEKSQRLTNTLAAYDPFAETVRLGHKYGMEVWAWESLYDDGANMEDPLDPHTYPEEYAKWGAIVPGSSPWFNRNLDGYAARNPRTFIADADAIDKINKDAAGRAIRRIVFKSDRDRPESTLARFNKDGVLLYVSDDNANYRLYDGAFKTSVRREKGRNVLEIDGLDIRERYVQMAHANPYPRDGNYAFAISEASGDHAVVYDAAGQVLPTRWTTGFRHKGPGTRFKFFWQLVPRYWDDGDQVIGFLKGAPHPDEGPKPYFEGMAEFLVPKTMEYKLARFREIAEYGVDGFMFNIRNHSFVNDPENYGYNPEVRERFLQRHGKDIWKDDIDHAQLQELRAEGVSQFLAKCKEAAGGRPIWFSGTRNRGPDEEQPLSPQHIFCYGRFPWQYRQWFADGSVDGIVMIHDYFPEYFTPEITGGRKIALGVFRELGFAYHRGWYPNYDFAADLAKAAALPIDEFEMYETTVLAQFPHKIFPFIRSYRAGGLPGLEAEVRRQAPETVLAQFGAHENWTVDYRPADGLPSEDVWTNTYAAGRLELVETAGVDGGKVLRIDNTGDGNDEWPLLRFKDRAALVQPGETALFEARLRLLLDAEADDPKKPNRFYVSFSAAGAGGEAFEVGLLLGPESIGGSPGTLKPGKKLTDFFTLQVALDPYAHKTSIWLDGELLFSGPAKHMEKDPGPSLLFGDGSSGVGGRAELSRLRFGSWSRP